MNRKNTEINWPKIVWKVADLTLLSLCLSYAFTLFSFTLLHVWRIICLHSVLFSTIAFHCPSALPHFSALLHVSLYLSFGCPTGHVPSVNSPYNKDFTERLSSILDTWPSQCRRLLTNNISITFPSTFLYGPQRNPHVSAQSLDGPRARVWLYPNHDGSFTLTRIVIIGDVEINPGPETVCTSIGHLLSCQISNRKPVWKFPCDVCAKSVRSNQKGIMCYRCDKCFHLKCSTKHLRTYIDLSSFDEQWICNGIDCTSLFNFSDFFFEPAN